MFGGQTETIVVQLKIMDEQYALMPWMVAKEWKVRPWTRVPQGTQSIYDVVQFSLAWPLYLCRCPRLTG